MELAFSETGIFRQAINFIFKASFIQIYFSKFTFIIFQLSIKSRGVNLFSYF